MEVERVKAYHNWDIVKEHKVTQEDAVNHRLDINAFSEIVLAEPVPMAATGAFATEMKMLQTDLEGLRRFFMKSMGTEAKGGKFMCSGTVCPRPCSGS